MGDEKCSAKPTNGCLAKKNLQPAAVGPPPLCEAADDNSSASELPQAATSVGDGSLPAWNEKVSTEGRVGESESFAGQLDQSIDGDSVAGQSYTHSFADTDNQGVDQQQGTSEGGDEDDGWDAEDRLERPGGVFEDTLDLFGRYLASILRQLPDTPCYSLQQKFIDEAISARLSFGPSAPGGRSPTHKGPQPPEDGNKKPLPSDSSRRTWSQNMKPRSQKKNISNTTSSAEAPVPPVLAANIKEEVVDDETFDALNDQGGGIDIEEHELPSVKSELDTNFELVMCDGLQQGSTGFHQSESTVSVTSTEKASPFRCLMCPKTFVRSSGLKNHYRDKHPDCDAKPLNEYEQQLKRPCLEGDRQVSTGILQQCLMDPGKKAVLAPPSSAPTAPAQKKTLLFLVKPTVPPASLVAPSHTPSVSSISSAIPGPSFVPDTNPSQVPISNKPGPSVQSQQSSSTQSVQNQPFFLDPQYHAR